MNATTSCKYCGQNLEYDNDLANVTIECPECCRPVYLPKYIAQRAPVVNRTPVEDLYRRDRVVVNQIVNQSPRVNDTYGGDWDNIFDVIWYLFSRTAALVVAGFIVLYILSVIVATFGQHHYIHFSF